jgi:hypothetical protein
MRFRLIILLTVIGFSASAQGFHIGSLFQKKKHPVLPPLQQAKNFPACHIAPAPVVLLTEIKPFEYDVTEFTLEAREKLIIKEAKHNMSWRIYNLASYNFSDLAQLYIKLHRLSEAKWYLLQSNNISRTENDDKHTIANLISLAYVKDNLGDIESAKADLVEARDLAQVRGMKERVEEIETIIPRLGRNKSPFSNRYAETAQQGSKDL